MQPARPPADRPIRRLKEPGEGQRYVEATRALFDLDGDERHGRDARTG